MPRVWLDVALGAAAGKALAGFRASGAVLAHAPTAAIGWEGG